MSDADLELAGLSLWVGGRALPDSTDFWDGNWLSVKATFNVARSSVTTEGAILRTTDFERFRSDLGGMRDTFTGEALLSSYEPNLKVTLLLDRLGHINGQVEITPDQLSEFHRFDIELDQTHLPLLIASCEAILDRFPVIDPPER